MIEMLDKLFLVKNHTDDQPEKQAQAQGHRDKVAEIIAKELKDDTSK
jgi:hypothetical protein